MEQTAKLIKSLQAKKTVFIVTHDPELILRCCTHVLHIDHGEAAQVYPLEACNQKKLAAIFPNLV